LVHTRTKVKEGDLLCKQAIGKHGIFSRKAKSKYQTRRAKRRAARAVPIETCANRPEPLILGEMACLSGTPRTADVRATSAGEIWEIRRNVLDRIMRSPRSGAVPEDVARARARCVLRNGRSSKNCRG